MKLLHPQAQVPTQGSEHAAGYDIYCVGGLEGLNPKLLDKIRQEDPEQVQQWEIMGNTGNITIQPGHGFLFRTGLAMAIAPGHVCCFWDRSGMGGFKMVHRFAGVIDEDYRGEWLVRLFNHSRWPVIIHVGDRIVQGLFQERIEVDFPVVSELPDTARGAGGFGSSGG